MPDNPHRTIPLFIHPVYTEPEQVHPDFGFGYFCMPYKARTFVSKHPVLTYVQPLDDFRRAAQSAWSYLRSYRQPTNGAKTTRWQVIETLLVSSFLETIYMTRKTTPPRTNSFTGELQFLDVRLSQAQFDELDAAKMSSSQLLAALTSAITQGYKFSFSYNPEKKTANAMLVDNRFDSPTKGQALSAFSDDCQDALKVLMYKHVVILEQDWTHAQSPQSERRKRG